MTYKQNFLRLVVQGTLYNQERFAFSMALIANEGAGLPPAPTAVPQGTIDAVRTFWTGPGERISEGARLTTIKINEIGVDGKYVNDETVLYDFNPTVAGTSGTHHPPQVALAVTLGTDVNRGRAKSGRFYLPAPGQPAAIDGLLELSQQMAYANAAAAMLSGIEDSLVGWQPGVTSNLGNGEQRVVTNLRVGRVFDTIRTRRNALNEDYYERAYPGP